MKFIKIIMANVILVSASYASAGLYDPFLGAYKVMQKLESVCTYNKADFSNDPCADAGGWNLGQLLEVKIYKDTNPQSYHYGKTFMGTSAYNSLNLGDSADDESNWGGLGVVQQVTATADGLTVIRTLTSNYGPKKGFSNYTISKLKDGTYQFTFEGVTYGGGHQRYTYSMVKK